MTHEGYDAAYPPAQPPTTDVVLIYAGGDTPHAWTPTEIAAQTARYRLPVWVRSYAGVNPQADAEAFLGWLRASGAPVGTATVLDLETLVDPPYVAAFGGYLNTAGYKVLPYGSRSTLYQNPQLDGYFDANPEAHPGTIDPGNVATQNIYTNAYDLDTIADSVPLWDTHPAPPVPLPGPTQETSMAISPTFQHNGQKHVVQVSVNTLWHKYLAADGWHNETLAGPNGGNAAGCANNKVSVTGLPGVTNNSDGSVDLTFEGLDNSAWNIAQGNLSSEWIGGKLP